LLEELIHARQLRDLRLDYFRTFGKWPSAKTMDGLVTSRNLQTIWHDEVRKIMKDYGFERLTIGG